MNSKYKIIGIYKIFCIKLLGKKIHIKVLKNILNKIQYRMYDYQFYISNEMRMRDSPIHMPSICTFERFKFLGDYKPINGKLKINGLEVKNNGER